MNKEKIRQDLLEKLPQLCDAHGVSGYEEDVTELVKFEIGTYVDEMKVDALGNLIAKKSGNGKKKVMVAAHLDEIGLMIRHIDENGFLYAEKIGGVRPQNLFSRTCVVKTKKGIIPGVINSINPGRPKQMTTIPEVNEFFIDVGASDLGDISELGIEIGNTVAIDYEFKQLGKNKILGRALDNRLLMFVLIQTMKYINENNPEVPDIYPVFTVQEEVGCRGALTAAYTIEPDEAVALDITIANDTPQIPLHERISELGGGPSIKLMDKVANGQGSITPPKIVEAMKKVAYDNHIPFQLEVISAGTTDAATIQLAKGGVPSGGILVPTRYVHAHEMASIDDIVHAVDLLYHYLVSLGE